MKNFRSGWVVGVVSALVWCGMPLHASNEPAPLAEIRARAERGDVQAMVEVAQRFDWGNDGETAQDFAQARAWYEKAAAKGSHYAAYQMAGMFKEGRGIDADPAQAFSWMKRAAEAGFGSAQVELGEMHADAFGTPKNLVEALSWYLKAAEQHNPDGMYLAGAAFAVGRGTKKDPVTAVKWLQRAYDAGREDAGEKIGELRDADPELGAKLLAAAGPEMKALLAAAEAGKMEAQVALAKKLQWGETGIFADDEAALGWWRKAAEQGSAEAQAEIGSRYVTATGVEMDLAAARKWLEKAAAKKRPEAFFWLGAMHDDYAHGEPNLKEAARYYRLAAEIGHSDAQKRLGQKLEAGEGVNQNKKEALAWYVKAAEQGDVLAMMHVGMLALDKDPAVRDVALAKTWLKKRQGLGYPDGDFLLDEVFEAEEAERLAKQVPASVPERLRNEYVAGLKGDGEVALWFAERYRWGRDGLPRDAGEALKWLQRSAEAGSAKGAEMLGEAYLEGTIVAKNAEEAVRWLGQAADKWNYTAAAKLADIYLNGDVVLKSETEAARWLERAALDNRDAMWRLSRLYSKGLDSGAPDQQQAEKWLNKAVQARQPDAEKEISRIYAAREAERLAKLKAEEEAKYADALGALDAGFAAATSVTEREKAVEAFSRAMSEIGFKQGLKKEQISERVLQALVPRMQARVNEAGAYVMAIHSLAFDQAVMNRVLPESLKGPVKAHAQQISAAFHAKQQALGPIQQLIDPALKGDVAKQMELGAYFLQNHAARDEESALRWFKRAADAGHAPAKDWILRIVGPWYLQALGLHKQGQFAAALELFKKVADAGEPDAAYELGGMYYYGEGVPNPDRVEAMKWYRSAAEKGMTEAMFAMGWMHRNGDAGPVDDAAALQWFERAAGAGHAEAKSWVAVMAAPGSPAEKAGVAYRKGLEIAGNNADEQKLDAAAGWFLYAKRLGHAKASEWVDQFATPSPPDPAPREFDEGMAAYQAKNYAEALAKWTAAAEKGSAGATFNIGVMHEGGQGVPRNNVTALSWFEKAAAMKAKGAAGAVRRLRASVAFDEGLTAHESQDYAKAMEAWRRSAELGSANAMANIGVLYANGSGVDRDPMQAIEWYEKAAAAGSKRAVELIAKAKEQLVGVDELQKGDAAFEDDEYEQAVDWYGKAAGLGNVDAMMKLGHLYKEGDGVDENPRKALEWFKKAQEKGDAMGGIMAQTMESSLPMYEMMASQKEMKRLRAQINGEFGAAAPAAVKGPRSGSTVKQLRKRAPWSVEEVRAALKDGVEPDTLARVLKRDKMEGGFNDLELRRLLNSSEGQLIEDGERLSTALHALVYRGAGDWTLVAAKAAVQARRKPGGKEGKVVDSPELRAKVAAGDVAAMLELYHLPEGQRTQGPAPEWNIEEMRRRITEAKYVRGYWFVAGALRYNSEKAKDDPVRRAELLFESAEAGEPRAMRELALELVRGTETAIAANFLDAEHWLMEGAARAADAGLTDLSDELTQAVAMLYSFARPFGANVSSTLSVADEPTLRWARELLRRGGKLADVADVYLESFERDAAKRGARAKMNELPPEVPEWSAAEVAKLEAAVKAGDAEAALKLGNGYASGRGVRQWDGKAVVYFELAAAKGNVAAMRALAQHYLTGFGVKKDGPKRLAWLEKAGEAGDASAWTTAGDLQHYGAPDPVIPKNFDRAIAAYHKAVSLGHGAAMHGLGVMHHYGRGVPEDKTKAVEWYRKAAEAGERFSMTMLGGLLKDEKKFTEAAAWYGKAADAGEEQARFWQAQMLTRAGDQLGAIPLLREVVARTPANSSAWLELGAALHDSNQAQGAKGAYRKVIELVGESDGQGKLAKELLDELEAKESKTSPVAAAPATGKSADELWEAATQAAYQDKPREVVRLIQAAAAIGETASPWNRYRIALALAQGSYGMPKDEKRARELLESAAETGFASAKLDYALAITQGALGFTADPKRGQSLLAELVADADNANADAKYQIGMLVFHGKGVPADRARGINLVKTAAEWNVPAAQFEIGRALLTGMPELPADPLRGVEFLQKAMKNGVVAAAAVLGEVYEKGMPGPAGGKPVVAANPQEALKLYEAALHAGVQQVKPAVERLQLQLSGRGPPPASK